MKILTAGTSRKHNRE